MPVKFFLIFALSYEHKKSLFKICFIEGLSMCLIKFFQGCYSICLVSDCKGFCPEVINPLKWGHKSVSNRPLTIGIVSSEALMSYRSCISESFNTQR